MMLSELDFLVTTTCKLQSSSCNHVAAQISWGSVCPSNKADFAVNRQSDLDMEKSKTPGGWDTAARLAR